jgi:hypothetical protein
MDLIAVYVEVSEGYIALLEKLPGANTQGDTLRSQRKPARSVSEGADRPPWADSAAHAIKSRPNGGGFCRFAYEPHSFR